MAEPPGYDETRFTADEASHAIGETWRLAGLSTLAAYVAWFAALTHPFIMLVVSVTFGAGLMCVAVLLHRKRRQWRAYHARWAIYLAALLAPAWLIGVTALFVAAGIRATGGQMVALGLAVVFLPIIALVERSLWSIVVGAVGVVFSVAPQLLTIRMTPEETILLIPTVLATIVGAIAVENHRYIRRRIRRPGFCHACGYHAQALDRCPECGGPVEPPARAVSASTD